MNFTNRNLHLSPEPADGGIGGGAPATAAPAGDGGAPAAPAFDQAAFKNELLGSFRQEIGSHLGRFRSEIEPRLTPAQQRAEESNEPPSMEDKKYLNSAGEMDAKGFQRWQTDLHKHLSKTERADWEKEYTQKQSQQQSASSFRKSQAEHIARESEYEKTNPSYRQDLIAAGDMEVNPQVGQRILASKYSANIIHHFAKNRADFVQFQALSYDDPAEAIEMLGELRAKFAGTQTNAVTGLPPKPTRAAFGGTGTKQPTRGTKEIVDEWRG